MYVQDTLISVKMTVALSYDSTKLNGDINTDLAPQIISGVFPVRLLPGP